MSEPVDGKGWSFSQVNAMKELMPHLRQFLSARQALVDARALGTSAIELLCNDRLDVIRLDRRGRIVAANDRALAMLNARDGLRGEDGCLRAALPAEDARLQRLLARALPSPGGVGGSMLVTRRETLPRLALHVSPVGAAGPDSHESRIGALVLADDPAVRAGLESARLAEVLHLTPAESRVAALLVEGRNIDAVAAAMGRSRTTVKWHLRHIFAKHDLTRQSELVQLVRSLSDLRGPAPGGDETDTETPERYR